MKDTSKTPKTVSELEDELSEADRHYRQAATSEAFLAACERLREASHKANQTKDEAVRAAPPANEQLEPARRFAQGIPSLQDLRLVMFPRGKSNTRSAQAGSVVLHPSVQQAQEKAQKAHGELLIAFDEFTDELERVKDLAEGYVLARLSLEAARSTVPSSTTSDDTELVDQLVLTEVAQLPALEGLEEFYVPR